MKKIILFFLLFILSINVFSQQGFFYIKGIAQDSKKKNPLQHVSVFAENTTITTVTDANGNFLLQLPNGGYNIVVALPGYTTEVKQVSSSNQSSGEAFLFLLKKKMKLHKEVAIAGSHEIKDGWEEYGNFFASRFAGKTLFSRNCHILNHDVLKFFFSKRKKKLKVLASGPIEIVNTALGYKIKYYLDYFIYDYATQTTAFNGYPLFEEMKPLNDIQLQSWKINRMQAYDGSILHFMRSVYDQTLEAEGFEIKFELGDFGGDTSLALKDFYSALNYHKDENSQVVLIKPARLDVAVIYGNEQPERNYLTDRITAPKKYQLSVISINRPITIEANGFFYDQNDITYTGYWEWCKVGNILPYDFIPG